jgi:hypothetical protein
MMNLFPIFLALPATIASASGSAALAPSPIAVEPSALLRAEMPYEKIAKDFATGHGLDPAKPESIVYEDVLTKCFVQLRLGIFDVRFPPQALEKRGDEFKVCAGAMLAAEEKWLDWLQASGGDQKAVREDLKTLQNWVKGWKTSGFSHTKDAGGTDFTKLVPTSDSVLEASKRFATAMSSGTALGPAREQPMTVRIVITPSRKDFCEFVYFAGWVLPDNRAAFWLDSVPDWTQCYVQGDQVLALEYAVGARQPGDYSAGTAMGEILQQQVAQLSMNSLFVTHYGDRVPSAFIGGLSMNLVVDVYGQVNTRVDGDTRGKVTPKREVFVAGGASQGGFLAKNSAETKWRENGGKDHFLPTLRNAQKEGEDLNKNAKTKLASFCIRSDKGGEKWPATGPFLGSAAAAAKPPPTEFAGDFAEFVRAYKSGFIYWLQTKGAGTEKVSRDHFAALLKKLADPNMTADFEDVFKQVYEGAALSGAEVSQDSLEGRFLIWLSKSK